MVNVLEREETTKNVIEKVVDFIKNIDYQNIFDNTKNKISSILKRFEYVQKEEKENDYSKVAGLDLVVDENPNIKKATLEIFDDFKNKIPNFKMKTKYYLKKLKSEDISNKEVSELEDFITDKFLGINNYFVEPEDLFSWKNKFDDNEDKIYFKERNLAQILNKIERRFFDNFETVADIAGNFKISQDDEQQKIYSSLEKDLNISYKNILDYIEKIKNYITTNYSDTKQNILLKQLDLFSKKMKDFVDNLEGIININLNDEVENPSENEKHTKIENPSKNNEFKNFFENGESPKVKKQIWPKINELPKIKDSIKENNTLENLPVKNQTPKQFEKFIKYNHSVSDKVFIEQLKKNGALTEEKIDFSKIKTINDLLELQREEFSKIEKKEEEKNESKDSNFIKNCDKNIEEIQKKYGLKSILKEISFYKNNPNFIQIVKEHYNNTIKTYEDPIKTNNNAILSLEYAEKIMFFQNELLKLAEIEKKLAKN